jgi:hypothetical protein
LLKPISLEPPTYGLTEFEWQWNGQFDSSTQGFEVRVWREGGPPLGVHNALEDNQQGKIVALGNSTYRLIADISNAPGVLHQTGMYSWTVVLVQISPGYEGNLGIQAAPGRLRFEAGGSGSSNNDPSGSPGHTTQ